MRLNVALCRSAKKTAASRGLRRSTRNSSRSSSCLFSTQQEDLVDSFTGAAVLPVSTIIPPSEAQGLRTLHNYQGKLRQNKKRELSKHNRSLKLEAFKQNQLAKQSSFKVEALVNSLPCRQESFKLDDGITLLLEQGSFNTGLAKQRSSKLEASAESGVSRQSSLKLEALIEPRVLNRTSSCTTIGRKRVVGVDDLAHELDFSDCSSPSSSSSSSEPDFSARKRFAFPRTPSTCLDRSSSASLTVSELGCSPRRSLPFPQTPSTPTSRIRFFPEPADEEFGGDSLLEELPFDLLLRIVCCLEHDDLMPVSLVCKRLMKAVWIAQQSHFSFTTPHREKKGRSAQIYLSTEEQVTSQGRSLAGSFICPPTPDAPKHSTRPAELRFSQSEACPLAPRFIQLEPSFVAHSRKSMRVGTTVPPHRVLFDEDELCDAVAQNTL